MGWDDHNWCIKRIKGSYTYHSDSFEVMLLTRGLAPSNLCDFVICAKLMKFTFSFAVFCQKWELNDCGIPVKGTYWDESFMTWMVKEEYDHMIWLIIVVNIF